MPKVPDPPERRRKARTAHSKRRAFKTQEDPRLSVPLISWLFGLAVGFIVSLSTVMVLNNITQDSRRFLPAARATAAQDSARAADLTRRFAEQYRATGFLELQETLLVPWLLTSAHCVTLKNKSGLMEATQRLVEADESLPGPAPFPVKDASLIHPFHRRGERLRYSWLAQAACVTENWELAIEIANDGINRANEYWQARGGVPVPTDQAADLPAVTVNGMKGMERRLHALLIWALACNSQDQAALDQIQNLLSEPLAYQDAGSCIHAELWLLRAAIEWKAGQTRQARESYFRSHEVYNTRLVFDYGRGVSRGAELPFATQMSGSVVRPASVEEGWRAYRSLHFSVRSWSQFGSGPRWSFRDPPRDFTDDFLDAIAREIKGSTGTTHSPSESL